LEIKEEMSIPARPADKEYVAEIGEDGLEHKKRRDVKYLISTLKGCQDHPEQGKKIYDQQQSQQRPGDPRAEYRSFFH
jgi:hypothetical protein